MGDHHQYPEFTHQDFSDMSKTIFSKHVTLVCGGNGRIGKELCKMLVQSGHYVIVWDKDDEPTHECLSDYQQINLTNPQSVTKLAKITISELEEYDVFSYINVSYPQNWTDHFSAFLYPTTIFAELMSERGGNIILFSSIYGQMVPRFDIYEDTNVPEAPAWYGMCKSAIDHMVKFYAKKYRNLQINSVCPGGVYENQDISFVEKYEQYGKMLKPNELNNIVMYLLKEKNITGQNIVIDGGFSL